MQVRHHEASVMHLQVQQHRPDHDAGQATHHNDDKEREHEVQRRLQVEPGISQGGVPAEDLHGRWNRDGQTGGSEKALADLGQVGREHVVHPKAEGQEGGGRERQHHGHVAEHGPARERRDDG